MAFREKVLGKLAIPKRTRNAPAKIDGTINNEQRKVVLSKLLMRWSLDYNCVGSKFGFPAVANSLLCIFLKKYTDLHIIVLRETY